MLGVRPPEYWPRLSYLALILSVSKFVMADTCQYSRQSFQNRTKLRTPQGWQWISIPLKGGQHGKPITDVRIENRDPWLRKHWRSLEYNYRSTPFFEFYEPVLLPIFEREWDNLGDLTCTTTEALCRLFDIKIPILRSSELNEVPTDIKRISILTGEKELLSPGEAYAHDASAFSNVRLFKYREHPYRQNFEGFRPDMSALDLLFNYGPDARSILVRGIKDVVADTSP